ncbi:MAG: hypothetical protein LQ344_007456 [Seirophora lacunosa]|nr:MAG: hypothetical protein LQ344_007456 [Seirophora lacunosa]
MSRNREESVKDWSAVSVLHGIEYTPIQVSGSVRTIRKQKRHAFLEIGDGSTIHSLQVVLSPDQVQGLSTGASVTVQGVLRPSPPGKEQSHELHAEKVDVIGAADPETYPIQKKFQTPEFLRTIPHLRLRLPLQTLLARMRSEADFLLAQFFRDNGFLRAQTPVMTSSDCEGAGEVFSIGAGASAPAPGSGRAANDARLVPEKDMFFRKPKFLTVSAQLHLEAYMQEHPKVWTFAPTFRAERSDTPRHVSEFWMLEAELRTHTLQDIIDLVEDMVRALVRGLDKSSFMEELMVARRSGETTNESELAAERELLKSRWENLMEGSWPKITYAHAVKLLQDSVRSGTSKFLYKPEWEAGLQLEHERFIAATVGRGKPVFVTNYPQAIKPFYMLPSSATARQDSTTSATAACFDLLLPEMCEVAGGSLREHRLQHLTALKQHHSSGDAPGVQGGKLNAGSRAKSSEAGDSLDWYVDLRRYGSVPHGGFGFGFDRFLCYLSGISNIKDVIPWPRYYGRCDS